LHPETKQGSKGGWNNNKTDKLETEIVSVSSSFAEDTASKIGVTDRTVRNSIQRAKAFTTEQREVLKQADVSQTDATKLARLEEPKREAAVQKIATSAKRIRVTEAIAAVKRDEKIEKAKSIILPPDIQLLHGDFREAGQDIADNSVSLIFTDPPYHEKHLELWSDLGSFAARVLKPGGMLLAYSGQTFLPQVLNMLSEHLDYCWLIGQYRKGEHLRFWKFDIFNRWKPLVLFSKGEPIEHEWFQDAYEGVKGDKDLHEWSQSEDEAQYFIQKLTQLGDLVVDPMCGSGPIVRMSHRFKRRAIGIEIEKQRYDVALGSMEVEEEVPA
jgi:16S rRNA G966 N2-methylase RsmD